MSGEDRQSAEKDAPLGDWFRRTPESLRMLAEETEALRSVENDAPDCHEGVSRGGRYEPCERPAVGLRIDPEDGRPYPVCKRHHRPPFASVTLVPDHPGTDPGDGRTQCETCGKYVWPFLHSCKGVRVYPSEVTDR